MLLEHHEDGRVVHVIHAAVEEDGVTSVFGRRPEVTGVSFGVVAHKDAADKHASGARVSCVVMRVLSIPGKVAP